MTQIMGMPGQVDGGPRGLATPNAGGVGNGDGGQSVSLVNRQVGVAVAPCGQGNQVVRLVSAARCAIHPAFQPVGDTVRNAVMAGPEPGQIVAWGQQGGTAGDDGALLIDAACAVGAKP